MPGSSSCCDACRDGRFGALVELAAGTPGQLAVHCAALRFTRADRRITPCRTRSNRGIASSLLSLANIV